MIYFSKTTRGFYRSEVHGTAIPSDSVEIAEELWAAIQAGQQQGQSIGVDESGAPMLQDPLPATPAVPDSATSGQVIVWLKSKSNANGNFLAQVDAYCDSLERGHPIRTAWEREPVFYRDSPTFQGIVQLLQLTPQEVDQGLIEANQITF